MVQAPRQGGAAEPTTPGVALVARLTCQAQAAEGGGHVAICVVDVAGEVFTRQRRDQRSRGSEPDPATTCSRARPRGIGSSVRRDCSRAAAFCTGHVLAYRQRFHSSPRRDMTLLRLGAAIRTATTLLHSNGETSSGA